MVSKKQSTVETSVFGTEFVAMKHGINIVRGISYKLRISGLLYIYGGIMSVVHNIS